MMGCLLHSNGGIHDARGYAYSARHGALKDVVGLHRREVCINSKADSIRYTAVQNIVFNIVRAIVVIREKNKKIKGGPQSARKAPIKLPPPRTFTGLPGTMLLKRASFKVCGGGVS
ncbi:unnamed protein product [Ectocarpus sp. 12 AP-2014]